MATRNQLLDMSPVGMIFTVLQSAVETGGKSLDLHWKLLPGCNMKSPLIHMHPHAVETYEILEGKMEFYIKNKWIKAVAGDKLAIPEGVTHCFRNPTDKVVTVFNMNQPAFRMEHYFEDVCRILDKLTQNRTGKFKMDFTTKLYMSVLMNNYRFEIIARKPPDIAIKVLGQISKLLRIHY